MAYAKTAKHDVYFSRVQTLTVRRVNAAAFRVSYHIELVYDAVLTATTFR